ncbi:MAG: hypothetical protein FJ276_34440 [Planctomycetes bacterium]|nr:hypothetical protein [Planctomycetota bacterium]
MSTHQLYETLTEMVRQGPGHVVAFVLGIGSLAGFLFSMHWLSRRPLQKQIRQLSAENKHLHETNATEGAKLRISLAENEKLQTERAAVSVEAESLRQTKAHLETSLTYTREESDRLRVVAEANVAENRDLRETKGRLEGQLEVARAECQALHTAHAAMQEETRQLLTQRTRLETEVGSLREEREKLLAIQVNFSSELVARQEAEVELTRQVAELSEQTQRLAGFDGKVWERASTACVPTFRPRRERGMVIIALANLKGGVGKTTLTANLGAVLSQHKRVLLVDLDYQGSLTSLCLPPERIEDIRRRGEFVDRVLRSPTVAMDDFRRCCHEVPDRAALHVMAADENLADVENRAMAEWLLHPDQGDVRHVLRSYLHTPEVWRDYDYVLLDCPPRLTTACINALAATDFVLIPVIPDQTSAEAVPRQLRAIKRLQDVLCPQLEVLGLVANRTSPREQLVQRERAIWDSLRPRCEDPWGKDVYAFRTLIRQKGAFGEAARANRFAAFYQDVEPMFRDLVDELLRRIADHERVPPTTVSAEPRPAA